jgi:hypothetical protein
MGECLTMKRKQREPVVQIISMSREVSVQLKLKEIITLKKEIRAIREEVERLIKDMEEKNEQQAKRTA